MTEQIVKFETAKILKEKGWNFPVVRCYNSKKTLISTYDLNFIGCEGGMDYEDFYTDYNNQPYLEKYFNDEDGCELFSAPTQTQVQKWMRETHGIYVMITQEFYKDGVCHLFQVCKYKEENYTCSGLFGDNGEFSSYEDCLEEGILYALNLI